ncbi:histidine kinase [Aureimonas altamirensis]|uniref:Blue-light-activated histidine kinase n=1 Tax=Aureimonas altamirensis TaxID=370622 RepID=A0A0B1PY54_9HYPH|nr:PAS domain-containing protein [Aureimonas altamirensis]KHJ53034.1 histidine kinase [Aureimonas altamirensis]
MDRQEERRIEGEIHKASASNDPFAAAVRTTRMPMLITDPHQPDNPIIFANDAFGRLTGYDRHEVIGRNCRFLQGTGTNTDDVTRIRNAVARCEAIEVDLLNYRKDGSSFWNRLLVSPVFDEDGNLTYFFASQFDVSPDRRRVSELQSAHGEMEFEVERRMLDLMQSEGRMRFILNAAGMGVWTLDLKNQRLVASRHCKANFGRAGDEPFSYADLQEAIVPEDRNRWRETVEAAIASSDEFSVEYRIRTPSGETRWVEVRGQVSVDITDQPSGMAGISIDITERKEAEEHRKLLARELNHRVKNSLATAQSVFAQSMRSARTLDEAQEIAFGRMQALSMAQDLLTQDGFSAAQLEDVVSSAIKPFDGGAFRVSGPRVVLGARSVSAFALALHELATNASKYGALSTANGTIAVTWRLEEADGGSILRFHWSEQGGPPVRKPERRGFGTRIIEGALSAEINGSASIDFRSSGIAFEAVAPLKDLMEDS